MLPVAVARSSNDGKFSYYFRLFVDDVRRRERGIADCHRGSAQIRCGHEFGVSSE